ncbi:MAG: ABC transporter permease [Bacteroidota bacterium]
MIKNYFLVAVRNLRRHKLHSSINIIGLAIGMTCCILITLFVQFELSYDTQNKNAARIHRLVVDLEANDWAISAFPLGALLKENFPEVESFTRIKPAEPFLMNREADIRYQQKIFYADATVFDILDINLIKGNPETALAEINSIVMTPERAKAYFGNQDPIGKTLSMANDSTLFQVTGIFEPLPANSHVHIDVMVSSDNFTPMRPDFERAWSYLTNHYTYLLLPDNIDHVDFGKKVSAFLDEYHEVPEDQPGNIIKLQPLTSIHLASDRGLEIEANGNMNTVYIFSAIAFFILIIFPG